MYTFTRSSAQYCKTKTMLILILVVCNMNINQKMTKYFCAIPGKCFIAVEHDVYINHL